MVNSNQPERKPFCIPKRPCSLFQAIIYLLFGLCLCQELPQQLQQQQHQPTPVIGGLCRLDSPDVQIGGKQTQFFLRCEPTPESAPGDGVWVVKSRTAGTTASRIPASALVKSEQQQQQQRKAAPKTTTYLCDLVSDAYEHGFCSTPENCLQPVYGDRNAFLQCNPTTARWSKKHCQQGFTFDFERQACIAHTTAVKPGHQFRQFPSKLDDDPVAAPAADAPMEPAAKQQPKGIVCTFSQCSSSEPCNVGTCNNGYCCSAAVGSLPASNFPAEYPKPASAHPNPTTGHSNYSSSSSNAGQSPMPPSILVIAFNEQSPTVAVADGPSARLEDFPGDGTAGTGYSLQRLLAALRQQQQGGSSSFLPRSEPAAELCSSGFRSPIRCLAGVECPLGLACDLGPNLCCPLPPTKAQQKVPKWAEAGQHQQQQQQKKRMALRRRLARRRFARWCSPCMPFSLLVSSSDQQIGGVSPNLFSTSNLFNGGGGICPGGVAPLTSCASTGYCSPPLQCVQPGICCSMPAPLPPPIPQAAYACPGGLPALGQCIGGRCFSPSAVCTSPANVCCSQAVVPAAIPATVCPDGTQAAGACVNNLCGAGFTCNQGLCCTNSSQTPRCLDGSQSIGACIQGRCGTGYTCTTGNICCPSQLNPCPAGQVSIGQAVNGRCPTGFTNVNGQCCGTQSQQSQISCPEIDSTGPCDASQQCPEAGFACDTANNWCCPQVFENEDAIGPCIQGEGGTRLCPEGYACVGEGDGECRRLDTGTCPPQDQLGPCGPNNECPDGYECIEGFCCRIDNSTARRFRQRRRKRQADGNVPPVQSAFLRLVRGSRKH